MMTEKGGVKEKERERRRRKRRSREERRKERESQKANRSLISSFPCVRDGTFHDQHFPRVHLLCHFNLHIALPCDDVLAHDNEGCVYV